MPQPTLEKTNTYSTYITPFDSIKTSGQTIQFAIDPSKGLTRKRYGWFSDNILFDSTHFTTSDTKGTLDIETGSTTGNTARLRSAHAGQYVSQSLAQPGLGVDIDDANVEYDSNGHPSLSHGTVVIGAGWHNQSTGGYDSGETLDTFLGIKYSDNGAELILKSGGSHIGGSPVPQSEWNQDAADGTGPSGIELQPESGYIYNFPYTWYGYGALYCGVVHPQSDVPIYFHRFDVDKSTFDRPNLSPMVVADNGNTASSLGVSIGGMQYALYGTGLDSDGFEKRTLETSRLTSGSYVATEVTTNNNSIDPNASPGEPLVAIRREPDVRDLPLSLQEVVVEADYDVYVYAWDEYDEETALNGTWRQPNMERHSSESFAEVSTDPTSYTPTTAVSRGYDKILVDKKRKQKSSLKTDDRVPIGATRVYTAVHDGTLAGVETRVSVTEGY